MYRKILPTLPKQPLINMEAMNDSDEWEKAVLNGRTDGDENERE